MTFADRYGPWGLVAGASDGVGAAFAEALAERGVNVALLARRQALLDEVAAGIGARSGVQTRAIAVDLAAPSAAATIAAATAELEIGFLVYCAGADPNFEHFLVNPIETAEAMVQRNCTVPMQLCHHYTQEMVARGRGGVVLLGSAAGFAGAPNMVAYAATKSFGMVFAEALWTELHDKGVDVLGLILGKTDTPTLRRLEHARGRLPALDTPPADADAVSDVISEAFDNLSNGPTWVVGEKLREAVSMMGSLPRNDLVRFMAQASADAMAGNGS
ncbi:SDR family NAD(P)-dependent oxidoreductase [Frankia sp. CNm7]|uniref:SDR family NAD(P)-dependent oxidoreductase n=1 Tax=Frankia nepalensis TaxID=1836974 RepID=A0A937REL5_9ACTN|nr:SDR family NAD(P)-dependent oxidoreductase [Frankia nepalensis]MBL7496699.1 SDR family NAD(P)-dependent oxidoreductase [Frankia nepalensis]MBL7511071.1 SDR family NAD(P)-dependent oxidoreductase [Frankia nepalensis]MBL7516707.1 SDR family NAD(P)-dependent oxidoreductase [Frankia nepalensis]MBL7627439.1 SDR family NAD(P)-dependent oxidoreductase [Frankia nepalensis]